MTKNSTPILPPRRRPVGADDSSLTAGHREVAATVRPIGDISVRELLVAGGLRGLTARELFT